MQVFNVFLHVCSCCCTANIGNCLPEQDFKGKHIMDKEFESLVQEEKAQAVNRNLNTLKKGMEEAEVCGLSSLTSLAVDTLLQTWDEV